MRSRRRALRRHWRDWRKEPRWQRKARFYVRHSAFYDRFQPSTARYLLVATGAPLAAGVSGAGANMFRPPFVSFAGWALCAFISAAVAWGAAWGTSLRFAELKDSVEGDGDDMRKRLWFYRGWDMATTVAEALSFALLVVGGMRLLYSLGSLPH